MTRQICKVVAGFLSYPLKDPNEAIDHYIITHKLYWDKAACSLLHFLNYTLLKLVLGIK